MGGSVQLPIYMYAMELSKTKLHCLVCFKTSIIMKFLDSRMTILMPQTALMDECVEVTLHHRRRIQAPLKRKYTKRC